MKVVVTEAAYADLLQIGRTIGHHNPVRAESFVAELYDKCRRPGSPLGRLPSFPAGKIVESVDDRTATISSSIE